MADRRRNILREAKENSGVAVTYMPVGYQAQDLSLERYNRKSKIELEDVLLTPMNKIREDFKMYQKKEMCRNMKEIRAKGLKAIEETERLRKAQSKDAVSKDIEMKDFKKNGIILPPDFDKKRL